MKKLILAAALIVAAAFPTTALAGTFTGVVVGKGGGNLAVAPKSGVVRTVHTRAHPRLGARVRVSGNAVRVLGQARRARIHAVVVRRLGRTTFLAAGRSLLVMRAGPARRLSSPAVSGPSTGAVVNTTVGISNGQLTEQTTQVVGQTGSATLQAQVTAVGPGTITVSVNSQPLTIALPAGIQLPASLVGQFVTLTLRLAPSGPTATAEDEDEDDDQGEDADDHHEHEDDDD
jgi:hypothetical protein